MKKRKKRTYRRRHKQNSYLQMMAESRVVPLVVHGHQRNLANQKNQYFPVNSIAPDSLHFIDKKVKITLPPISWYSQSPSFYSFERYSDKLFKFLTKSWKYCLLYWINKVNRCKPQPPGILIASFSVIGEKEICFFMIDVSLGFRAGNNHSQNFINLFCQIKKAQIVDIDVTLWYQQKYVESNPLVKNRSYA